MDKFLMTNNLSNEVEAADAARQRYLDMLSTYGRGSLPSVREPGVMGYGAMEGNEIGVHDVIIIPRLENRAGRRYATPLEEIRDQDMLEIWEVRAITSAGWRMERVGIVDNAAPNAFRLGNAAIRMFTPVQTAIVPTSLVAEAMREQAANHSPGKRSGLEALGSLTGDRDKQPRMESEFIVTTLDGQEFSCRTKNQGLARVREIEGMIRAMGRTRVTHILRDLTVVPGAFWQIVQRYRADHICRGGIPGMESMNEITAVGHLPICGSEERLESFISMKHWPMNDWGRWSLEDFLPEDWNTPEWGKEATLQGKAALVMAVANLEKAMVVFFNQAFEGCFASLRIFSGKQCISHSDGFLRFQVEDLMATWHNDMNYHVTSWSGPNISMATPEGCAEILRKGAEEIADRLLATPKGGLEPLERPPHVRFFQEGMGAWAMVANKGTGKRDKFLRSQSKGRDGKLVCAYELASRFHLKSGDGSPIGCKWGDKCSSIHPDENATMEQMKGMVTKEEVTGWRLSYKQKTELLELMGLAKEEYM